MKQIKLMIKRYIASLLVVSMLITQYSSSYAQAATETGMYQNNPVISIDAEVRDTEQPAIPEEETDYEYEDDEIPLEDDRYGNATISNAYTASQSNAVRVADDTFYLYYYAKEDDKWNVIYVETVLKGDDGIPPKVPERDGYTFAGWNQISSYVNVQKSASLFATYVSGDVQLHEVRFVNAAGRLVVNPQYVETGKGADFPSINLYERTGYTFLGWDREFYNIKSDEEIKPRYKRGENEVYQLSYQAYYNDNWRTLKNEWVPEGADGLPPEVPEVENRKFSGWMRDSPYVNVKRSTTVIAKYEDNNQKMHVVNYVDENERLIVNPEYVIEGRGANPPPKSRYQRTGYTFLGWDQVFWKVTKDMTVRPRYVQGEHEVCWLTYSAYHGNLTFRMKEEWVPIGGNGTPPQVPPREGYTFAGWTNWTGKGDPSPYLGVNASTFLDAVYVPGNVKMHVVSFYAKKTGNDSYVLVKQDYVREGGEALPPEVPGCEGHNFREWQGNYKNVISSSVVIAQYDMQSYTVKYWDGKTLLKSQVVTYGGAATPPVSPKAPEGYYFSGWDKAYGNVHGDMDIYAVFERQEGTRISEAEFRSRIVAMGLPGEVEDSLIELGIQVREWADSQESTRADQRMLPLVIPAGIVLLIAVAAAYIVIYCNTAQINNIYIEFPDILDDFVSVSVLTMAVYARLFAEIKTLLEGNEGGSEAEWETALAEALGLTVTVIASTITIGNVNYKCDTDAQVIVAEMERQKHQYYPAVLSNGTVWVAPVPISRKEAIAIMMLDNEFIGVFALSNQYARGLCGSLGGARGPEKHGLKGGYWYHFHGKRYPDAHCWYIGY